MAEIDYDALAAKFGAEKEANGVDYDALAAKFGGENQQKKPVSVAPLDPGVPEWARSNPRLYGLAGATREVLGPVAEMGGLIGGGLAGAVTGPVTAIGGAGLGYGLGKQAARGMDLMLGNVKPAPDIAQEASIAARNVGEGAMMEMGGQMIAPVVGGIISGVSKGVGKVTDIVSGNTGRLKAADIVRKSLGPELDAARVALKAAPDDITAGQALANVNSPTTQSLLAKALDRDPRFLMSIRDAQEAARKGALTGVMPNQAEAEAVRESVAGGLYKKAFSSDIQRLESLAANEAAGNALRGATGYTPPARVYASLRMMRNNPVIQSASKEAKTLAATQGVKLDDPMESLQGLHYMKLAIDSQFKSKASATALQKYSDAALTNTKSQLLSAIDEISPLYGVARGQYAELSSPVNQSKIIKEMLSVLEKPGGGERIGPFLNALGRGEQALIKKGSGAPRYEVGDLANVLTPQQMSIVNRVSGEMKRDMRVAEQVKAGEAALSELLDASISKFQIPNVLNPKIAMANRGLRELEKRIGKDAMNALTEGAKSGKSMDALLETLPTVQKNNVLRALSNPQQWMPQKGSATSGYGAVKATE